MTAEKTSLVGNGRLEQLNWNRLEEEEEVEVHSAAEEEQEQEQQKEQREYYRNYDNDEILEEETKTKMEVNVKKKKKKSDRKQSEVGMLENKIKPIDTDIVDAVVEQNAKQSHSQKDDEKEKEEQIETEDLLGLFTMVEDGKQQTPSNGSSPENKKNRPDLLDNEDNAFESFDEAFTRRNPEHSDKEDSLSDHDHEHNSQEELEMHDEEYYYMQKQFHTEDGDGNVEKEKEKEKKDKNNNNNNNNNNRQYVKNVSKAKARNSEPMTALTSGQTSPIIPERKIGVDLHKKGVDIRVHSDIHDDDSNQLSKKVDEKESTVQNSPEHKKPPPTVQAPKPPTQKYDCLPELRRGTALLKYGRQGYPHFRQFNLSQNNDELVWFSARKNLTQSSIRIKDIEEILSGQHTKEFRRISWTALEPASFTIWYDGHRRTLNLVAKSVDEMKMWIDALRLLREKALHGEDLSKLRSLEVTVDFKDRNRPQSRKHSGNFLRSNETKDKDVDPIIHRQLLYEMATLTKTFQQIKDMSKHETIQKSHETDSINQILSELEERIEELKDEVRHTRNTRIAENDVWRTRIDLEALREKISVLIKANNKKPKRRFSIF